MNVNACLRAAAFGIVCASLGIVYGRRSLPTVMVDPAAPAAQRDSYQFFDTLVDLRSQIVHNYVENVDDEKLLRGAIKGMMGELDTYSNYFTKDELANFDRAVHGQFSGIGAEIAQDPSTGHFVIVSPLEDSPALKAGVYAGDRIVKLNGEVVDGMSQKELLAKISGDGPGSVLKMTLIHEGDKTTTDVAITRAVIQVHSVRGVSLDSTGTWNYLIDPEHRIGYVRVTNFMENTAEELDKALLPLINDKANGSLRGIILDLRFNPGGLLQAGIDVSKRFLDSGVIVSAGRPDSAKRDMIAEATKEKTYPRIPLVVLINEYSASASEIVAGALKDHHRAVLIGARSFGKGSVQTLVNLDNGNAALKLTTQYYYLPSGKNIMRKKDSKEWGVEPDAAFNVPLTDDENRAVLIARNRSEIIHKGANTATAPATAPTASAPATAPADADDAVAATPGIPPTAPPATAPAAATTAPATAPADTALAAKPDAMDRQLERAVGILVAYQAFGPAKDFAVDVTTTRPGVTASIPTTGPATQPATPGELSPVPELPQ